MFASCSRQTLAAPSLVCIDATVADIATLCSGLTTQTLVHLLLEQSGIGEITARLRSHHQATGQPIQTLHLVAHGSPGSLRLGSAHLSLETLPEYATELTQWRDHFSTDAEILLYGCQTGAGAIGREFIQQLSELTGAKVAASSTVVGNAALGGNWELDVRTAPLNGVVAFSAAVQAQYAGAFPDPEIVSVNSAGEQIGGNGQPVLSFDGRYVVFSGMVRDRTANTTQRIGEDVAHEFPSQLRGFDASISADGRYIAFVPQSHQLGENYLYVYDQTTQSSQKIDLSGVPGLEAGTVQGAEISANGNYITFDSGTTNGPSNVFVYNRVTEETSLISQNWQSREDGFQGEPQVGNNLSEQASISGDGRFVAFSSYANDLTTGSNGLDDNPAKDIFLHDRLTNTTSLISSYVDQFDQRVSRNGWSSDPIISANGRYVVFRSTANDLDKNDHSAFQEDFFVYDRLFDTLKWLDIPLGNGSDFRTAGISADGRYITFASNADGLVPGEMNGQLDAFVYDQQTDEVKMVSVNANGEIGNGISDGVNISGDGQTIAFGSFADNLASNDTNNGSDIFVQSLDSLPELEDLPLPIVQLQVGGWTPSPIEGQAGGFLVRRYTSPGQPAMAGHLTVKVRIESSSTTLDASEYDIVLWGQGANSVVKRLNATDYAITFLDGQPEGFIGVQTHDDQLLEPDEFLSLKLLDDPFYTIDASFAEATLTVQDDEPGTIAIQAMDSIANEQGNLATYRVERSHLNGESLGVQFQLSSTSTAELSDFTLTQTWQGQTRTIAPDHFGRFEVLFSETDLAVEVQLQATPDAISEDLETVDFILGSSSSSDYFPDPTANQISLSIEGDNTTLPEVSLSAPDATATEQGDTGTYRITRNGTVGDLIVEFQVANSSTVEADDFALSGNSLQQSGQTYTITIPDGSSFVDITAQALLEAANLAEPDENLVLDLVGSNDYRVGKGGEQATVVIAANDQVIDPNDLTVTNTNDSGVGSLRQAILNANAMQGKQTITVALEPAFADGVIELQTALPEITNAIALRVFSFDKLTLDGQAIDSVANGLTISAGNTEIEGLAIINFKGHGIELRDAGNNQIVNNNIGLDRTGLIANGNQGHGIFVENVVENDIRQNYISGNHQHGLFVRGSQGSASSSSNQIANNYIGLDITQSKAISNGGDGIRFESVTNFEAYRNTIAGSGGNGISLIDSDVHIRENIIGAAPDAYRNPSDIHLAYPQFIRDLKTIGNTREILGNLGHGIYIDGSSSPAIEDNRVVGSGGNGITVKNSQQSHSITRNTFEYNGGSGVFAQESQNVRIDDNLINKNQGSGIIFDDVTSSGAGTQWSPNLILGNQGHGIEVSGNSREMGLDGNIIGGYYHSQSLDWESTSAANGGDGIHFQGLPLPAQGFPIPDSRFSHYTASNNWITNNRGNGIYVDAILGTTAFGNGLLEIVDNRIGLSDDLQALDALGQLWGGFGVNPDDFPVGNSGHGIVLSGGTQNANVSGNAIADNRKSGVVLSGLATRNNQVSNNQVGLVARIENTHQVIGNDGDGILITNQAVDTNKILKNSIVGNAQNGIHLTQNQLSPMSWVHGNILINDNFIGASDPISQLPSGLDVSSLGNGGDGIRVHDTNNVEIGLEPEPTDRLSNTIANNQGNGVTVVGQSEFVDIRGNAISANGGLGIDLGEDGRTANDFNDQDAGANGLLNTPVLTQAVRKGDDIFVKGEIQSWPGLSLKIDLYSNTANSPEQGENHNQTIWVDTDGLGQAIFTAVLSSFPIFPAPPTTVTAIATTRDQFNWRSGGTSEFSDPITITPPAIVQVSTITDPATETGDVATYRIERDRTDGELTVQFKPSTSSTADSDDYTLSGTGLQAFGFIDRRYEITLADGQAIAEITLTATDDFLVEPTETVVLELQESGFYEIEPTAAAATATIIDNDEPPIVSITTTDDTATEGADTATYRIERDNADGELTVKFMAGPNSLASVDDYTISGTSLTQLNDTEYEITLADGQAGVYLTLTATDDALVEPTEFLSLELQDDAAYQVTQTWAASASAKIADNDQATVGISAIAPAATEGGDTATYRIERDSDLGELVVTFKVGSGTDATPNDYALNGNGLAAQGAGEYTVTLADGETFADITLTATDDALVELTEKVVLELQVDSNYAIDPNATATSIEIIDNTPNPDARFVKSNQTLPDARGPVFLADLDDDGDLDMFIASNNNGSATLNEENLVLLNDGQGNFSDTGQQLGESDSFAVAFGDFDNDGDLDAFVANRDLGGGVDSGAPNRVWLNDGQGNFSDSGQRLGNGKSNGVEVGDLDGDGDLDAFVANDAGEADKVWLNDGQGNFSDSGQSFEQFASRAVRLGDIDRDGDLDAVVANGSTTPYNVSSSFTFDPFNPVWFNDGSGEFSTPHRPFPGTDIVNFSPSIDLEWADLDDDGDLDVFIAKTEGRISGNPADEVWLNGQPYGPFQKAGQTLPGDSRDVSLGDIDRDGDIDAIVSDFNSGYKAWLNDGQGNFTHSSNDSFGTSRALSSTLGDLDGDGDLDVVVHNFGGSTEVWLNGGEVIPNVSLQAVTDAIQENGSSGIYRLERDASQGELVVQLELDVNSTAIAADYQLSGAGISQTGANTYEVTFATGADTVDVQLEPNDDAIV